jgi:hypothetical protein
MLSCLSISTFMSSSKENTTGFYLDSSLDSHGSQDTILGPRGPFKRRSLPRWKFLSISASLEALARCLCQQTKQTVGYPIQANANALEEGEFCTHWSQSNTRVKQEWDVRWVYPVQWD